MEEDYLDLYKNIQNKNNIKSQLIASLPLFIETIDSEFINCKNGILEIKTGVLNPHTPQYMTLSRNETVYNEGATCPLWIEKINDIMENDEEKIKNLQMFGGYCLTKSTKFHKTLILIGDGRNGKGVIMETLQDIIGLQNTSKLSIRKINDKFALNKLVGKQVNFFDETPSKHFLETDVLRGIVAGGNIGVEKKGVESIGRVGFGGGQVDYALSVHETIKNYKEPGTGAKYLENPLKENAQRYFNKIADDIKV